MNVTNNITCDSLFQSYVHQTLLCCKEIVCVQNDLPYVSFGQGFAILEPLHHSFNKFQSDRMFAILVNIEFGTTVIFVRDTLAFVQVWSTTH